MLFAPAEAWPVSITSLSSSSNKNSNTSPCANISSLYIVLETSNRWKVEGHQFETVTLFCQLSLDRNKRESLALAQKLLGTKQPKLPLHTCHLFRTWNLALTFLHAALTDMCRYARTAFVVRLFCFFLALRTWWLPKCENLGLTNFIQEIHRPSSPVQAEIRILYLS